MWCNKIILKPEMVNKLLLISGLSRMISGTFFIGGKWGRFSILFLLITLFSTQVLSAPLTNGFDLSDASIPVKDIFHGGPPRDGIPAIDKPVFVTASNASHMRKEDRVLGLVVGEVVRAYPINILNYHEIVNDKVNNRSIVVSFCPLCGSGMVYEGKGKAKTFGVSGLLYNSDMLLYDRESESLWSQILSEAVTGPLKGQKLINLPVEHTTWSDWQRRYPSTQVMTTDTGYFRDYSRTPYPGYDKSRRIYFPVTYEDKRYHPKSMVLGIKLGDQAKVYPFVELDKLVKAKQGSQGSDHRSKANELLGASVLEDILDGRKINIEFNAAARSAKVTDTEGRALHSLTAFWFAWLAFYPETDVYVFRTE